MRCAACGAELPHDAITCSRCGAVVGEYGDLTVSVADPAVTAATAALRSGHAPSTTTTLFSPGAAFSGRYHVIRLLGAGGMGAVYQAWDNELGVAVALKVIRPEVMVDPDGARDLERRFKRELLLARQVTHKNVVRIHDLGEIDGIKYITMPYIQGTDLASRLKHEGRLPVAKVVAIARQVAQGLAAAHEAGVVHRDLKPANIMLDEEERAIIMDFGIARSTSGGATMLGTVVGTLEYMAPEQAMAQPVDHRADIYAFGLILRDLLLGRRPAATAESAVAELMNRMQRLLPSIRSVDPSMPEPLEEIVSTCLEPDPAMRFQSTVDLIAALERLDSHGQIADAARDDSAVRRSTRPAFPFPTQPVPSVGHVAAPRLARRRIAAAALIAIVSLAGAAYWLNGRVAQPTGSGEAAAPAPVQHSLAVLPFRNQTQDASLDWLGPAIAEMLKGTVPPDRIRTVSADRVFQVLRDLRVSMDGEIDSGTIKRVAEFSNATTVVSGRYLRAGGELRLEAVVRDMRRGLTETVSAALPDQRQLMDAVSVLGRGVEEKLFVDSPLATTGVVAQPSTQSVDALRSYSEGVELSRRGNHLEALKRFTAAVKADASFALAHAKLAQTYSNLGHDAEAEQASRLAVQHAARLPERERYRVDATHAQVVHDQKRAIDAYEKLLRVSPDDPDILFDLARRYEAVGAFEQARTHYLKVVESDPKYFEGLFAVGRLEVQLKRPQDALDYLNRALTVAINLDNDEGRGSALNAIGVAYKRLGRPVDALRYYTEALAIRSRIDDKRGMAATLSELAQVHETLGKTADALASYERSLQLRRDIGDKRGTANGLNNLGSLLQAMGRLDDALRHYKEALQLQTELGNTDYQGLALHNIGITLTAQGRYDDAASYLARALQIREKLNVPAVTSETLRSLGELQVRLAQYEPALGHYLKALELSREAGDRRGAALAALGTGIVFEQQGRYGAALDTKKEALDGLRAIREPGAALVEALAGYAHTFSLVARHDAAGPLFQEATAAARDLADASVVAQALNFQGEDALLGGRTAEASTLMTQAMQKAVSSSDQWVMLLTRLNLAKAQLSSGQSQAAGAAAAAVATEAARLGLKYVAADASLTAGEALAMQKAFAKAKTALENALRDAERIGARPLTTRAHYAMAMSLRLAGQPAAAETHYREASRLLAELQNEAGGNSLVKRADLSAIAAESRRKSPASN